MTTTDHPLAARQSRSYWSFTMNNTLRFFSALVFAASVPLTQAHDPAEHAKEAAARNAAPDCAAMKDMDHSKMDPNDPVMKAMMAKCGNADGHSGMDHSQMQRGTPPASAPGTPPDAHGSH
jgi:uncharacterized protein involved in copper resistance